MKSFSDVKNGTQGTDVYILQALLRAMQYVGADGKPIDVDGDCGENTEYAINTFQSKQKAYGYDCTNKGVFDSACWSRLLGE